MSYADIHDAKKKKLHKDCDCEPEKDERRYEKCQGLVGRLNMLQQNNGYCVSVRG